MPFSPGNLLGDPPIKFFTSLPFVRVVPLVIIARDCEALVADSALERGADIFGHEIHTSSPAFIRFITLSALMPMLSLISEPRVAV